MDNLTEIAKQAMIDRGFYADFPSQVIQEVQAIHLPESEASLKDMRDQLWISIDNDDSLDLDQLTFAENNKIYVAVADVCGLVRQASAIDQFAMHNTTSVYTPTKVFPMLPPQLSTNLTSLNEKVDRAAIVTEIDIGSDGSFNFNSIYLALVRNQAKLAYKRVASWLDHKVEQPHATADIPGLGDQLKLQDSLAQRIRNYRKGQGALSFSTKEMVPVVVDGIPVQLKELVLTRANALIENFMIAANVSMTRYFEAKKLPVIKRIVRTPERWDRIAALAKGYGETLPPEPDVKALQNFLLKQRKADPQNFPALSLAVIKLIGRGEYVAAFPDEPAPGHFDLALRDYSHTTAPNRRYPDLLMQRLLLSSFKAGPLPYSSQELAELARHCTEKEDDASKVQRRVNKSAAAMVLAPQVGQQFAAMVTGNSPKGTWVRLLTIPVEGKLVQGFQGIDVGDPINVKLLRVDVPNGFIDFVRVV